MEQMIMGIGNGELNLKAVRVRAEDLRRTLDQLLQTLQFAPATLTWSDALDKFAVLNVQIQHLSDQLRPLLRHYVIHPRSVNQSNAPILPIMLASRLLPEQEAEIQEKLQGPASAITLEDIATFNATIDSLVASLLPVEGRGGRRQRISSVVSTRDIAAEGNDDGVKKAKEEARQNALAAVIHGTGLR